VGCGTGSGTGEGCPGFGHGCGGTGSGTGDGGAGSGDGDGCGGIGSGTGEGGSGPGRTGDIGSLGWVMTRTSRSRPYPRPPFGNPYHEPERNGTPPGRTPRCSTPRSLRSSGPPRRRPAEVGRACGAHSLATRAGLTGRGGGGRRRPGSVRHALE